MSIIDGFNRIGGASAPSVNRASGVKNASAISFAAASRSGGVLSTKLGTTLAAKDKKETDLLTSTKERAGSLFKSPEFRLLAAAITGISTLDDE